MPGVSFDRAADYYDATRGYAAGSAERIRDAIVGYTGASVATRFLELGVGTGRIGLPFIRAGYDYTGVDISQAMMNQLRAKLAGDERAAEYRLDLRQADVAALPFAAASFDVIITVHVLHLVSDWQAALHEARRVLRPGGHLLIGYDAGPGESQPAGAAAVPEPLLVREKWLDLRRELGFAEPAVRANIWGNDGRLAAFLEQLGARAEVIQLATYERPPISPRTMAERLRERMYSSDWGTPDELHAEALRRLDEWFGQTITAPDTPVAVDGQFAAIVAVWDSA